MGRMYGKGKGISASCLPYKRTAPSWLKTTSAEVEASVCRLAKKGLTPSQIGVLLRDQKGIGQVKAVTGSKILRILKKNGRGSGSFSPRGYVLPDQEGCGHEKAPRAQQKAKFRLILIESRIHRLTRYYKRTEQLPPTWKYNSATASALVA
ncbi:hypothetical protein BLSTO_04523 [Blastocystis sp. subtype 1]